jgi:hypothetical protein
MVNSDMETQQLGTGPKIFEAKEIMGKYGKKHGGFHRFYHEQWELGVFFYDAEVEMSGVRCLMVAARCIELVHGG